VNIDLLAPSTRELFRRVYTTGKTYVIEVGLVPLAWADYGKLEWVANSLCNFLNYRIGNVAIFAGNITCRKAVVDRENNKLLIYLNITDPKYIEMGNYRIILFGIVGAVIVGLIFGAGYLVRSIGYRQYVETWSNIANKATEWKEQGLISDEEYVKIIDNFNKLKETTGAFDISKILSIILFVVILYLIAEIVRKR